MSENFIRLLGSQIGTTILGMAVVSFRRKPQEPSIPPFTSGGFLLFLKVWLLTYVCALVFGYAFVLADVREDRISAFAHFILPSVCAFYIPKTLLNKK